ncbi:MAG TPA: YqaE/Pmp3 family membrane protein [Synechococcales cyanobacterium M55_K2018_004]|nr:YqaE/Pmp3 family membrane protein [Synechococcales cyanobacterium M55_K2018_004]
MKLLKIVLAVVLPPAAVFLAYGLSITLLINIGLTLIGWVPGVIHAVWALQKQAEKAQVTPQQPS